MQHQSVPDDIIDLVFDSVLAVDLNFEATVVVPIQSGDPVRAGAALTSLSEIVSELAGPDHERMTGRGWFYTVNFIATAQVLAGTVAAVATVAVAAAAVTLALPVILYTPTQTLTRFDQELRSLAVVKAL